MENEGITTWELPFGPIPAIELSADMAAVTLVPVEPDGAPRLVAEGRLAKRMRPEIRRDGDTLHVGVEWQGDLDLLRSFWPWGGKLRLTAYLPHGVRATVHADAGLLRARDLDGCELSLHAEAGAVDLENVRGRILVRASASKIEGRGLAGSFDVEASVSALRLGIVGLDPVRHRVRTEMGAAEIDLARGLAVRIEPRASVGEAEVDYPETPGAGAVLEVSTELGTVRVRSSSEPAMAPSPQRRTPYREPPASVPEPSVASDASGAARAPFDGSAVPEDALERVLVMVAKGKLSPRDAGELIRALGQP
jgi:hypothetical protein